MGEVLGGSSTHGEAGLVLPVRTTGLRFIPDPNCEITGTEVKGFIFVGKVIEPDRLGEPERIDPPKKSNPREGIEMAPPLKKVNMLKDVQISLSPVGPDAAAVQDRFIRVFAAVWDRLPVSARSALAAKWRLSPAAVFLTNGWKEQAGRLAQCSVRGSMSHFSCQT